MAEEVDLADWVNLLDYSASLSVENDAIAEELLFAVISPKDDDVLGIDLAKDWTIPRREVWDIDQLPGLSSEPEHFNGYQMLCMVLHSAGDEALLSNSDGRVKGTCLIEVRQL